jgi:S-layer protein (TIGR01567 family)
MAEKYFAGYPTGTFGISSSVDLMSKGQLSKVLIDRDQSKSIYSGAGLILEEGYVLQIDEIDINGDNVLVTLKKDGSEVTSDIVAGGTEFVYKKQLGSTSNVPIIAVNFKNIFRGTETNAVFVDGIFQISDEYITIRTGDTYGKMKVTNVASGNIKMENSNSFSLSRGNTIDIMGSLKFIVADSGTLRFAPFVDMSKPGTYELRGTVTNNTGYKWTPLNFEGFYYNIDEGIKTESLEVTSLSGSSISANNLVYTSTPATVNFDYTGSAGWIAGYDVAGFMAEKYFAGYSTGPFGTSSSIDLISKGQLSKVLIDGSDSRSIYSGAGLILEEGYVLQIDEIDINGDNVLVTLKKDGSEVISDIVAGGGDFVYKKQLGSTSNVPIIAVHFKNIFRGTETNAVFVDGIFQISDDYITINTGDTYGKMKVTSTFGKIEMKNDNSITLSQGQTIPIMGDILFKVADDSK